MKGPEYGETWVYESIVGALPWIDVSDRAAVAIQFGVFETAILVVAAVYDLWSAAVAGTVVVAVAAVGSLVMLRLGAAVRALPAPEPYRRLLFGSSIEVVLGVLAFVALVTYLFVADPRAGDSTLVTDLFGPRPPLVAVYLLLVVCWDVTYRIGTSWWASVASVWRSLTYRFDAEITRGYRRADALNVGFAAAQLAMVPLVFERSVLLVALCGHVVCVLVASGLAIRFQRASASST